MEKRLTPVDMLRLAEWIQEKPYYIKLTINSRKYQIAHAQTLLMPERMYKVWDYLRKNTDKRHPISIANMRKDENINAYIGDEERYERDDSDEDDSYIANVMRIKNLYYNRTFSKKEVDSIIESIMATRTLDSKSAQELVRKIEDNMTTVF